MPRTLTLSFLLLFFIYSYAQTPLGNTIYGQDGDQAGKAVALSADGRTMAIGAPIYDNLVVGGGQVRVLRLDGGIWKPHGTDILGAQEVEFLGYQLDLSHNGNRIIIGTRFNSDSGRFAGKAFVLEFQNGNWQQLGSNITGQFPQDILGEGVSISGDGTRIAVGSPGFDAGGMDRGLIRVLEWKNGAWEQVGKDFLGEKDGSQLGRCMVLSTDGSILAIGDRRNADNGANAGQILIYQWSGTDWKQLGKGIKGEKEGSDFGGNIDFTSESMKLITSSREGAGATEDGRALIFEWKDNDWLQVGKTILSKAIKDGSGTSVSISADGNRVAFGAPLFDLSDARTGHARVYDWDETDWLQYGADFVGDSSLDDFGASVALSADGQTLAVGAPGNDFTGTNAGQVKAFDLRQSTSIDGAKALSPISLYPNPTNERVYISSSQAGIQTIIMYDLHGRQLDIELDKQFAKWSVRSQYKGFAILLIQTEEGFYREKVLFE
ncbi:MAG: hypothetical protein AB8F95_00865 [Bacteroidia bacterium]